MQTTLENIKKVVVDSPSSVFQRKNKVEEGRASSSRVKKEQENTDVRAQKMMRGRVEPFVVPTVVQVMRQTIELPHMIIP